MMRLSKMTGSAFAIGFLLVSIPGYAADQIDHITLATSNGTEAVKWYVRHMECAAIADRDNAVKCGAVDIEFDVRPTMGSSQGTGIDHIGFSFADLTTKMTALERVGVSGSGVRMQRNDDGTTLREIPGLFKLGFVFDPWGTRIELVEDPETLGFHHIHLLSADPVATLDWYEDTFGGSPERLGGMIPGLRYDGIWLLATPPPLGQATPTEGRAIDHLAFGLADFDEEVAALEAADVMFLTEPSVPANGRSQAKRVFIGGPNGVRLAAVAPGWAGVDAKTLGVGGSGGQEQASNEPYVVPRTPWGTPDFEGVWTGDPAHGIPLERPKDLEEGEVLTAEEAAARRERGTLGSIWGYEREWRDTTLGYVKTAPSKQVAMIIDPPDGRLPALTTAPEQVEEDDSEFRRYSRIAEGPEDLPIFVRCITRGLPGLMMPGIYNNGLQIVQSPGFVAIQKEMIHETRLIPTDGSPHVSPALTSYLGDSRGYWEGDTLVVEVTNFNGGTSYRGTSGEMKLTERFTRVGPTTLRYEFTVDDPTVWTRPWTGMFHFEKDDSQYELVEYACHEGNYGMTNTLSGSRARERQAAEAEAEAAAKVEGAAKE